MQQDHTHNDAIISIKAYLKQHRGADLRPVFKALKALGPEHGTAGQVFSREAFFPKIVESQSAAFMALKHLERMQQNQILRSKVLSAVLGN